MEVSKHIKLAVHVAVFQILELKDIENMINDCRTNLLGHVWREGLAIKIYWLDKVDEFEFAKTFFWLEIPKK